MRLAAILCAAAMFGTFVPAGAQQAARVDAGVPYVQGGDDLHKLDVYAPTSAHKAPVLVWFHGGGRETGSRKDIAKFGQAFATQGVVVMSPSYRLRTPQTMNVDMRVIEADAARAVAWAVANAAKYGGDPHKVVVGGVSAGGGIAALLALDPRYLKAAGTSTKALSGAFIMSGVLDNRPVPPDYANPAMWRHDFGQTEDDRWQVSPLKYASRDALPMEISTAEQDDARFISTGKAFASQMQSLGAPVTTYVVKNNSHGTEWGHAELVGDPLHEEILKFVLARTGT